MIAHSTAPEQWIGKDVSGSPAIAAMLARSEGTLREAAFDTKDRLWAPVAPESALRPLSILIVDDDPLVLESLRATLESDGHKVTAVDGGQAGIDTFTQTQQRNEALDVVITDLGMPHVDGRRVAAAVKAASPSTPIVLLTGWGQRLVEDGDIPAHVDHVLNKPPKLRDLRAALSRIVPPTIK